MTTAILQQCTVCKRNFAPSRWILSNRKRRNQKDWYCGQNCYHRKFYDDEIFAKNFWSFVEKTETCWLWTGAKTDKGYGQITRHGKNHRAHRMAFVISGKVLTDNKLLLHSCDVPACVNPSHLYPGTAKQNTHDCFSRDRNPRVLFSDIQVTELRKAHPVGKGISDKSRQLAKELGVSWSTVYNMLSGRSYGWVK